MEATLVIPAHNEEERLLNTLLAYGEAMRGRFGDEFEIIVVANGCTDGTVQVAKEAATIQSEVMVVDIKEPVGKGGAVLEGFRRSNGVGVMFADADGATASESLMDLFDQLDHHDVVIGSRQLEKSTILRRQPLIRRACGLTFARVVRLLFEMPFRDTQCGAKAFRSDAAYRLSQVVSETRWTFDVDLLLSAEKLSLDVHEYPVIWENRKGSRLRYTPTAYEVLKALWLMKHRQIQSLAELSSPPVVGLEYDRDPEATELT
jgi:glycosyltransferase involved in cell wall biosynthesis